MLDSFCPLEFLHRILFDPFFLRSDSFERCDQLCHIHNISSCPAVGLLGIADSSVSMPLPDPYQDPLLETDCLTALPSEVEQTKHPESVSLGPKNPRQRSHDDTQ